MTLTGLVRTSALISLLGMSAMIYAQDQRDDAKPPQDEARPEATKPAQADEAKPPKQDETKPPKNEGRTENQENAKPPNQADRATQASGQRGGHIPDDKFRAHFGRQHTVVIHQPKVVDGQPRFQYGGYWFNIVDPWPVGWAYTDECYIDYVDGEYFLFDLLHPGVRVAIVVVM
jgi:hypothetical protein